jgi:hypothetical protein
MSNRYKGAVISATPPTTTGGESGTASGAWTLEQQMQLQAAGLWPSQPLPPFIEDVFSTYLYTGTGAAQTITNGINLSGKGGLTWIKARTAGFSNGLYDTARGANKFLSSNDTAAQSTQTQHLTAFNSNGFSVGTSSIVNGSANYVSWTFREQAKFFDVVTFTTTNSTNARISHNLGSVPGFYVIKRVDGAGAWFAYHGSLGRSSYLQLQSTNAAASNPNCWGTTDPTSTDFGIDEQFFTNGTVGLSYVAYVFASNAGGFGLTETDNVISCGTFSVPDQGPQATVTLGYEPQWIMVKRTNGTGNWIIFDTMRGWEVSTASTDADDEALWANLADAANPDSGGGFPTATGFVYPPAGAGDATYIYIAIRKGPMKVPTLGTSVFAPVLQNGGNVSITTNFPVDLLISKPPASAGQAPYFMDRLRGGTTSNYVILMSSNSDAEITGTGTGLGFQSNTAIQSQNSFYSSSTPVIWWNFRRAPSFFDEVCYTGNGATQNVSHNLGVAPELIIAKSRSLSGSDWWVYASPLTTPQNKYLRLQATDGESNAVGLWGSSLPTSTTFGLGAFAPNSGGATFVAYLFATCAGVSKVGSYTGNGTTQTIDCGFTGGARFVLIKRTSASGSWYVYDTARGMTVSIDPYLLLNSTAAEVATLGSVTTVATGFTVNEAIIIGINTNASSYIFLAIA